jgi:DNA-binding CsgD family transcriptional regulator
LFFYLLTVLTGVAALAVSLFVYVKTKYKLLLHHIIFSAAFTLFVFSYLFAFAYVNLNLDDIGFDLLLALLTFTLLAWFFLMFCIPFMAHSMVYITPPTGRNIVAAVGSALAFILMLFSFDVDYASENVTQTANTWLYASTTLFASAIFYSVLLKALNFKKATGDRRKLIRGVLTLDILFLPGVAGDYYLYTVHQIFVFLPLFYCSYHVLFAFYIVRMYLPPSKISGRRIDLTSLDDSLLQAGISPRERDIIGLILEGCSNKAIAERLFIAPNTVKTHNRNIFQKMKVGSRFELLTKLHSVHPR